MVPMPCPCDKSRILFFALYLSVVRLLNGPQLLSSSLFLPANSKLLTLLEGKVGRVTYHRLLFLCLEAFGGSPDHLVFLLGLPSSLTASDLLRIYPPLPAPHHKCMEHRRTWARTARAPEKPHPSRPGGRKGSRKI